jgi:hypothetical protein
MRDPHPSNIAGKKVHKFEHQIQWGYLAVGIGLLGVAWMLSRTFASSTDDEDDFDGMTG